MAKHKIEIVGPAHLSIVSIGGDGQEFRRSIVPACWQDGAWHESDISGEAAYIQQACAEAWTPEAVAAFKAPLDETMAQLGFAP